MSMEPFFAHVEACKACRVNRDPCSVGAQLLKEGAERLTRKILGDPNRAKA